MSIIKLVIFESRRFKKKTDIDFYNNKFPNRYRLLWTDFIIYVKSDLFIKILNFNNGLETWWRHQKSHVALITNLVFFERSYVVPHSHNFHEGWWGFLVSTDYLMSKKQGWLGLNNISDWRKIHLKRGMLIKHLLCHPQILEIS